MAIVDRTLPPRGADVPPPAAGRSAGAVTLLYAATFAYLVIPYVIFFAGWFRQPYSSVLIAVALAGMVVRLRLAARSALPQEAAPPPQLSLRFAGPVLLVVLVVALFGGAGGWGFQSPDDSDWYKHNAIFRDLTDSSWPVTYRSQDSTLMLTYYVAWQLPAALIGKVSGWTAANHALFLYTFSGLALAALWLALSLETRRWWFILLFLVLSGMDVLGQAISISYQSPTAADALDLFARRIGRFRHLEWWIGWGFAQFSSTAALINLVPNQAIPGWLLTALMLHDGRAGYLRKTGAFYLGLCTLWAPFVALGLAPLVAITIAFELRRQGAWRDLMSWCNFSGIVIGAAVAIYLAGRFQHPFVAVSGAGIYQERITLTFLRSSDHFLLRYVLFVTLEFALLHALLYLYLWHRRGIVSTELWRLFILSSAMLLALPMLNWGWNNEPSMRSSIPTLFISAMVTIRVLMDTPDGLPARWIRRGIAVLVALGSLNAAVEFGRQIDGVRSQGALVAVPRADAAKTLFQIQDETYREYYNFAGQYISGTQSFFAEHLARR